MPQDATHLCCHLVYLYTKWVDLVYFRRAWYIFLGFGIYLGVVLKIFF